MLACERWTLTHSSGWGAGLALALALALLLGVVTMSASRVAETRADGEDGEDEPVWDGEPAGELELELDEPVGELVWDGEPVAELDAGAAADDEPEPETDGDGAGALLGVLVGSVPEDAEGLGEAEPDELEEPEGDGDGDGDLDVGVGDGDGEGEDEAAAGSTTHVVSVFAPALAEVPGLAETAPGFIVSARAAPGQPASAPRVRDPPATRLSTAARTCARRMKTALSPLLFEVTACSLWGS